jgi:hypothetical protein
MRNSRRYAIYALQFAPAMITLLFARLGLARVMTRGVIGAADRVPLPIPVGLVG